MTIAERILPQFDNEMIITRRILAVLPDTDWDWRPHKKSTPLGKLGNHVANLAIRLPIVVTNSVFDLATDDPPAQVGNTAELLKRWDHGVPLSRQALAECSDEALKANWTLKHGDKVILSMSRIAAIRTFTLSHMIHHRGQLSVYLRLRDVPLPSIYGPSADTPI